MNKLRYTPFTKSLDELAPSDLAVLREVAEGWYIEYKSQAQDVRSLAKSISSFANHYGGWVFYGVCEKDDGSRTAGSFPGIGVEELADLEGKLRDAVRAHVNPPPYYETRRLIGPCKEINLSDGRAILVAKIPPGADTPYVHGSGRIYRRIADSSDPKPETDRHVLDLLSERGRQSRESLEKFVADAPPQPAENDETSFLHVFMLSNLLGDQRELPEITFAKFSEVMKCSQADPASMVFDNAFTMSGGFVGRHVHGNNPYHVLMTWRYFYLRGSVVTIPLPSTKIVHRDQDISNFLTGYSNGLAFLNICRQKQLSAGWILDLNSLLAVLAAIVFKQRALLGGLDTESTIFAKVKLENVWRRVPFIDTKAYADFIETNGLPMVQHDTFFAPSGTSSDSFLEIEIGKNNDDVIGKSVALIYAYVINALGIPSHIIYEGATAEDDIANTMARFQIVQKRRQKLPH